MEKFRKFEGNQRTFKSLKIKPKEMNYTLSTIIAVVLFIASGSVFAQNKTHEVSTMNTASVQKTTYEYRFVVDSAKLATKKVSNPDNAKTVDYYNHFIEALEIKREYVLNDPEEKAKAEESGWFEMIDNELAKAKAEREKLLQK